MYLYSDQVMFRNKALKDVRNLHCFKAHTTKHCLEYLFFLKKVHNTSAICKAYFNAILNDRSCLFFPILGFLLCTS